MRQTDQIDNSYALHNAVLVRKLDTAKQKEGTVNPPSKLQADPANELTTPSIASILTFLANCNTEFTDKGTSAKFSFCIIDQNMDKDCFRLQPVDTIAVCAPESFSGTLFLCKAQQQPHAPHCESRRPRDTALQQGDAHRRAGAAKLPPHRGDRRRAGSIQQRKH